MRTRVSIGAGRLEQHDSWNDSDASYLVHAHVISEIFSTVVVTVLHLDRTRSSLSRIQARSNFVGGLKGIAAGSVS